MYEPTRLVDRLRRPEYTGSNRCMPCTAVNVAIAAVGSALVGVVSVPAGVGGFVAAAAVVYLRGYLVPGTPALTSRYFPPWLLRLFGKTPIESRPGELDVGVEDGLRAAGAAEPCDDGELCLTASFRAAWLDSAESIGDAGAARDRLAEVLGVDVARFGVADVGDGRMLVLDDELIGQWESETAILADVAAGDALAEHHPGWNDLSARTRAYLLRGVRVFADTCPGCGGPVVMSEDTTDSCCGSVEVLAANCRECDARLLEVPA